MLPAQLQAKQFKDYPPQARKLAAEHLTLLQELPLSFAPLLLQQLSEYDWKFPAEQKELNHQLSYLASLNSGQREEVLAGFSGLRLSRGLERLDWVNAPGQFSEQLSAYLWSTHQIDAFRAAAVSFMERSEAAAPKQQLPLPRLGIVVVGQGVAESNLLLFRKLRPHGVYFSQVKPDNGLEILLKAAGARARAHPLPFAHWYIDGGAAEPISALTCVSYHALAPVRTALLDKIDAAIKGGIGGPEALRTMLHKMGPEEIGLSGAAADAVLSHFQASLLTEGSGTQIFSTTFVQWAAREAWRRAQPLTLFARFAPRQRERPMNELLSGKNQDAAPDPAGSLIDADMGAYYTWIGQQRLSGAQDASFLVWFEDHNQALIVSPTLPRHTESTQPAGLDGLLKLIT